MLTRTFVVFAIVFLAFVQAESLDSSSGSSLSTYREIVYSQTETRINRYNDLYGQHYTSGHNQFSHLTPEEFAANYLGGSISHEGSKQRMFIGQPSPSQRASLNLQGGASNKGIHLKAQGFINGILPSNGVFSVDYSLGNNQLVTPVKNQGACGACWAFAGLAEIESYFMAKHRAIIDLSEQQMVDCVTALINDTQGCDGGQIDSVAYYGVQFPIATEKYYPYRAVGGSCSQGRISEGGGFKINSYAYIMDCLQLASTLLATKPVSVCGMIDDQWQNYKSGVIPNCNGKSIGGHCVLLAGVSSDGTQTVATNFWKYKNSWGVGYGMNGYLQVYRDFTDLNGVCGLCSGLYSI